MKKKIILMSIFTVLFVFMGVYINEFNSYLYSVIGIISGWAFVFISKQNFKLKEENEGLKSANISLIQQQQKALDEIRVLSQKYSRANQPRSGGRFVTEPDESGITRDPKIGDRYICIKTVDMGAYIAFTAGKEYSSRIDGCITNNKNNGNHIIGKTFAKLHFRLIKP